MDETYDHREIQLDLDDLDDELAAYEAYLNEPPSCPVCDAWNCGGDGLGCKQFEGRSRY